jgi:hypothetical protein
MKELDHIGTREQLRSTLPENQRRDGRIYVQGGILYVCLEVQTSLYQDPESATFVELYPKFKGQPTVIKWIPDTVDVTDAWYAVTEELLNKYVPKDSDRRLVISNIFRLNEVKIELW